MLRPARRLLIFASVVTLALNVADPLVAGEFGKAAFDAVGPLLLIGWAEVGPGFLQAISAVSVKTGDGESPDAGQAPREVRIGVGSADKPVRRGVAAASELPQSRRMASQRRTSELLLEQAKQEDTAHRAAHQKSISADTLRVRLGIGATSARRLVKAIRAEYHAQIDRSSVTGDSAGEAHLVVEGLRR